MISLLAKFNSFKFLQNDQNLEKKVLIKKRPHAYENMKNWTLILEARRFPVVWFFRGSRGHPQALLTPFKTTILE